jgi:hypothetical protein
VSIQLNADRGEACFRWLTESDEPVRRGLIHLLLAHKAARWRIEVLRNTPSP